MEIVAGTIKYYPALQCKHFNLTLPFGWWLFYCKDAWSCDIILFGQWHRVGVSEYPQRRELLNIFKWKRYNTLYGIAWSAIIFGIIIKSAIARKASEKRSKE